MIRNEEWSTMRRLLFMRGAAGGSLKEYEVTGNPAVFQTNVAKPLAGFTIPFLPVQQGTGDPSPQNQRPIIGWQGLTAWRTGVNLAYLEQGSLDLYYGNEISSSTRVRTNYIPVKTGVKYIASSEGNGWSLRNGIGYDKDKKYVGFSIYPEISTGVFVTDNPDVAYVRFIYSHAYTTDNCTPSDYWYQFEVGETATPYAPYTGASYPVTFPATGKNLFDVSAYPFTNGKWIHGGNGNVGESDSYKATIDYIPCSNYSGETVTLNKRPGGSSPGVAFYDEEKVYIEGVKNNDGTAGNQLSFTIPPGAVFMRFTVRAAESDIQIEKGSTATAYEPFTNTVCGGTVYPLDGRMLVEWAKHKVSDFTWDYVTSSGANVFATRRSIALDMLKANRVVICEEYKTIDNISGWSIYQTADDLSINLYATSDNKRLIIKDTRFSTVQEFLENRGDVEFCYTLAEPIEIPLDPITIQTLIGDNTIWTDTNGSNTIKYKKKG